MFQIPNEVIEGIAVKTIGKYNELRAARAEYTASAADEREHAAGILGKHGIDGVGPIAFIELRCTANTHGGKAHPAVIAAASINGADQHALGSKPCCGVNRLDQSVIDEFANVERGRVSVSVDAIASDATKHVIASSVAHSILHDAIVLGAVVNLVDIVDIGLEVIGMDARFPVIVAVVYMLRRKTEIAQGAL